MSWLPRKGLSRPLHQKSMCEGSKVGHREKIMYRELQTLAKLHSQGALRECYGWSHLLSDCSQSVTCSICVLCTCTLLHEFSFCVLNLLVTLVLSMLEIPFEVVYVQQFRSHCSNLQGSNSFTVNKHITASLEFLSIVV